MLPIAPSTSNVRVSASSWRDARYLATTYETDIYVAMQYKTCLVRTAKPAQARKLGKSIAGKTEKEKERKRIGKQKRGKIKNDCHNTIGMIVETYRVRCLSLVA